MVGQGDIEARRHEVGRRWLQGQSLRSIAAELRISLSAVQRDVTAIREELRHHRESDLEASRARSVAVLREVQRQAWQRLGRLKDASTNVPGLLNTIMNAEQLIAKVEGTLTPDIQNRTTVNVLALPEWQATRAAILMALARYPEARIAVADALAQLEAPDIPPEP